MEGVCTCPPLSRYQPRILIVEDDADMQDTLARLMRRAGFATLVAATAEEAVISASEAMPDLMLLDLLLPDAHGSQVLATLDGNGLRPPVIVVSAVGAFSEMRRMFGLGVRDYVLKPFEIRDLVFRVEGNLLNEVARTRLHRGGVILDWQRFTVRCGEFESAVPPRVFQLLFLLMARIGEEVSWRELKHRLWMHADDVTSNTLHVHISRLRHVLRDARAPLVLQSTRGRGVRLHHIANDDGLPTTSRSRPFLLCQKGVAPTSRVDPPLADTANQPQSVDPQ